MAKIYVSFDKFINYYNALTALGAEVSYTDPETCDGLVLPGGGDVDPALYGQADEGCHGIDRERDENELAVLRRFIEWKKPVLGICRGCQLINVAFGGTLHQDIPGHGRTDGKDHQHEVTTKDPFLCAIYGERFIVNSAHHQSVDKLGEGLRALQWADDGTIEAIRHETLPIFAVQWHPERLYEPTKGWDLIAAWLKTIE